MEASFYPFKFKLPHINDLKNDRESILNELKLYALSLPNNELKKQILESLMAFHGEKFTINDIRRIYNYALSIRLKNETINTLIREEWLELSQKCKSPLENFTLVNSGKNISYKQKKALLHLCCYYHLFIFLHGIESPLIGKIKQEIDRLFVNPNLLLSYKAIDDLHQKLVFVFLQRGGIESLPFSLMNINIIEFLNHLGIEVIDFEINEKQETKDIQIVDKESPNIETNIKEKNVRLASLKDILTVRSYNVCMNNKLFTVNDIVNYFSKRKTFINLRNCGRKSNEELITLCNQLNSNSLLNIKQAKVEEESPYSDNKIKKILNNLNPKDWETFLLNLSTSSKSLSKRSENILLKILKKKDKFYVLRELLRVQHQPLLLKNVGKKSGAELAKFVEIKMKWFNKIVNLNEVGEFQELRDFRYFVFLIKSQLNVSINELSITEEDFKSKSVKLFVFLSEMCFSRSFHQNENEYHVFIHGTGFDRRYPKKMLDDLGKDLGITRERVRQIRNKIVEPSFKRLFLIKEFFNYTNLSFEFNDPITILNDSLIRRINENGETSLTRSFIGRVIHHLFDDKIVLGIDFKFSGTLKNYGYASTIIQESRMLRNFYIIDKKIGGQINFKKLLIDVGTRMKDKIEKDIILEKVDYLKHFVKEIDTEKINVVSTVLEKEFNTITHRGKYSYVPLEINENSIIIKRNTKWKAHEYVYHVLEDLGEPSHKDVIENRLREMFPEAKIKSVQGSILRYSDIFISFGRTSTYGLKKWEIEGNIKGGTIREIIEEYLKNWEVPKHINDITQHVKRFRESTNSNSIFYNLKIMNPEKNPFLFFKGGLIGLKAKNYYDQNRLIPSKSPSSLEELIDDFF